MLTLQKLKDMAPNTIFAQGEMIDSLEGINITNSGKMLKWIAIRGDIHDWTIYCHFAEKDYAWIKRFGDKIFTERNIRKLVECNDEAFNMYRY